MPKLKNKFNHLMIEDKISLIFVFILMITVIVLIRTDTAVLAYRPQDHFIKINPSNDAPKLDFEIHQTGKGSARLELHLKNIRLVQFCGPEDLGSAKGHAHIFVDGQKVKSFYLLEDWLDHISPGRHTITVSINQPPSHKVLMWQGKPVAVTKTVVFD